MTFTILSTLWFIVTSVSYSEKGALQPRQQPVTRVLRCASVSPSPNPDLHVQWTYLAELLDRERAALRTPAPGCPPTPALCRMDHVFDEIFVISLPRFEARYTRMRAQLDALDTPFTLLHAHDGRALASKELAARFMADWRDRTPSIFSLYLTQLGILQYFVESPMRTVLMLEDDVTFRADFPRRFDRLARGLPVDWEALWLGVNAQHGYTGLPPDTLLDWKGGEAAGFFSPILPNMTNLPGEARHAGFFGAFAVAFQREAGAAVMETMLRNRSVIDVEPYIRLLEDWPNQTFLASPPLTAMNIAIDSTLRGNVVSSAKYWNEANGIDPGMFNVAEGYYKGGEGGALQTCSVLEGMDRVGADIRILTADTIGECCDACKKEWPYCKAWSYRTDLQTCWLKTAVTEPVSSEPTSFTGRITEESVSA